ncbi:Metallo-beta-lactamase superfamily protein [Microbacterium sp. cf046]|uniref:ComEC/Rec2 family competence protein n=1 Tax=Microbacterium sp. cf046 TaxID=1761803 RepID=UPI0008E4D53E|nr:MBL fold metallo-hydrolase [Microbacterium sp. cf046]SFR93283.1 Metallo-beta-lactamase superfamily protein [Microbacterium sp. cf046]
MSDDLAIQFLPARQGDAIWIRWGAQHQMLIDMGTPEIGKKIRKRLSELDEAGRTFELIVVTHIDSDHIGGVLTGMVRAKSTLPPVVFKDFWFNGWDHIHGRKTTRLKAMGPAQGEELGTWLADKPWNEAFDRGPARRGPRSFPAVELAGGMRLTVLAPDALRLTELQAAWTQVIHDAEEKKRRTKAGGLVPMGVSDAPTLDTREQLVDLANSNLDEDDSKANRTSICLLLEYDGKRVLLTGDAISADFVLALKQLAVKRPELTGAGGRVDLDLVKMPHHGSQYNVTRELVEAVNCKEWVFTTDGTDHMHPDPPAIARLLEWGTRKPTLIFNERSAFNAWWATPAWRTDFEYDARYGTNVVDQYGQKESGITWPLPRR